MELLFEGFSACLLPCAMVLLVPGVAVAFAARQESTPAVIGYLLAAGAGSWLFLSARTARPQPALITLALAAAIFLLVMPFVRRLDIVSGFGGALAGAAAAALWLPCPGPHLTQLLTELPTRSVSGSLLLLAYLVGLLAPLLLLTALLHLVPSAVMFPVRPFMLIAGAVVLGLIALTIAVGLHDEVINGLATRSLS